MKTRAGFTLLELLVVILIITILGSVVGVKLAGKPDEARRAAAIAQLENFRLALKLYRMDNGGLPTQRQGLQALVESSPIAPSLASFRPRDTSSAERCRLTPGVTTTSISSPAPGAKPTRSSATAVMASQTAMPRMPIFPRRIFRNEPASLAECLPRQWG